MIYLQVYKEQSITHAAKSLYMTQPAVTRAIKELESFYGIQLFERLNKRLSPTEAGKHFYSEALHIVESCDRLEKELKDWEQTGILRVGASNTLGSCALPELAQEFKGSHPHLQLRVHIANGHSLQQALFDNQLDVALIEGGTIEPSLSTTVLREDKLILIMSPNHPLASQKSIRLHDLCEYDLLLREKGSAGRSFLEHLFGLHDLPLVPVWESTNTQALINAVSRDLGISLLPEQLAAEAIAKGSVCTKPIAGEALCRQNYLVWHTNKYLTPSVKEFMDLCTQYFNRK